MAARNIVVTVMEGNRTILELTFYIWFQNTLHLHEVEDEHREAYDTWLSNFQPIDTRMDVDSISTKDS